MTEIHVQAERDPKNPNSISYEDRKRQIEKEEAFEEEQRKTAKKSPYNDWLQVNKEVWKQEDKLMAQSPIAYRVFKFLMTNMDSYNAVMCSYKVLEEQFNVSSSTITRAIKILKDKKFIEVYKSGTSNIYAVNKQIAWNSWGSNFKHGKFGANIILSETEQEEDIKLKIEKYQEVKKVEED